MLAVRRRERQGSSPTEYGNVSRRQRRRHPARPAAARGAGRRPVLRRAGARHRRPDADRRDGRGVINILAADQLMQLAARSTRPSCSGCSPNSSSTCPRSATSTSPSWCSSSTKRTCCSTTRRKALLEQDRAGRAPDPLQGRRRLLRHAEPARHPRHRARPARQPRAARAARLHAARPEGGAGRRRDLPREPEARRRQRRSPSSASARRWSRLLDEKGRPGDRRARLRPAAPQPDRPDHAGGAQGADRRPRSWPASTRRRSTANSAYEKLKGRAAGSAETAQSMRDEAEAPSRPAASRPGSAGPGRGRRRPDGRAGRHPVRQHRPARRQARRACSRLRQVGGAHRSARLGRPRDRARRARRSARRRQAPSLTRTTSRTLRLAPHARGTDGPPRLRQMPLTGARREPEMDPWATRSRRIVRATKR